MNRGLILYPETLIDENWLLDQEVQVGNFLEKTSLTYFRRENFGMSKILGDEISGDFD